MHTKFRHVLILLLVGFVGLLALPASAFAAACNFSNTNINLHWATTAVSENYSYTPGTQIRRSYGDLGLNGETPREWDASVDITNNGVTGSLGVICPNSSSAQYCYRQSGPQEIGGATFNLYFEVQSYVAARIECTPSPTVPPDPATPSASVVADPSAIIAGSASRLLWNSTGVSSCSINQGIGSVTANTNGSMSVSPAQTTTYVLTCNTGSPPAGATWQYDRTDISDFSCPLTQNANAYNNVPNCPGYANGPQGQSCNPGSNDACKVNYANQSTCNIETTIYTCEVSGSQGSGTVSSAATVTVTQVPDLVGQVGGAVTASVNQAVTLYGGIANEGVGAAEYFPNLVQVCDTNCAAVNDVIAATSINSLAPGAWQQVSASYTPAAPPRQLFYRVCANNNTGWVNVHSESNYANNCSGWQYLTVGTPAPDLTASAITPTDATRGQARTLTATISNIGNSAAGASASYLQVQGPTAKTSGSTSAAQGTLGVGGTGTMSYSFTFTTEGPYSARACADWNGAVTELDEGNNCGPWTPIAITDTPMASSVSCNVNTTSVAPGGSVTYSAIPSGAATGPYGWTASDGGNYGAASSITRSFPVAGPYDMSVTASGATGAGICPRVTVAANWCTASSPTLTITASPARVRAGQTSTITWSATGVNGQNADCSVTGPGISWSSAVSAAPVCSAAGSATATINTQSTYTLACEGQTKTATVNVIPNFQEF